MGQSRRIHAFFLSLLVFPGVGHFSLGLPRRGFFFSSVTAALALILLIVMFSGLHGIISQDIEQGRVFRGGPDVAELLRYALERSHDLTVSVWVKMKPVCILLLICWLAAAADIFRVKRQSDDDDDEVRE